MIGNLLTGKWGKGYKRQSLKKAVGAMSMKGKVEWKVGHVVIGGLAFLIIALTALTIAVWKAGQDREWATIAKLTEIKDAGMEDSILPRSQVMMKYKALYGRWWATFTQKDPKKSMTQWVAADWICKSVLYEDWLDLPKGYFMATAIMESTLNPNEQGPCGEKGLHQQHPAVMNYIYGKLREIKISDPKLAEELEPKMATFSDLDNNPIASLKCQAIIAWGNKRQFNGNKVWWVSGAHWGDFRMRRYYDFDKEPDMEFVFYSKDGTVDRRNPLKYYFHWQSIVTKLMTGRVDIYQETIPLLDEYQTYIKTCNKDEAEYVETIRYKTKLEAKYGKLEARVNLASQENARAQQTLTEVKKLLDGMEEEYNRIYSEHVKKGKNYERAYSEQRTVFARFADRAKRIFK